MIRTLVTVFAGLVGLAFGSSLNVCLSRWPEGDGVVHPRSRCRNCQHTLAWWENVPLLSWMVLRGRCRDCKGWISVRYPMVESTVGVLWEITAWRFAPEFIGDTLPFMTAATDLAAVVGAMIFYWLVVGLAVLDAEHLWLPNMITIPGIIFGILFSIGRAVLIALSPTHTMENRFEAIKYEVVAVAMWAAIAIVVCAGLLLLIRWLYWVFRRREGVGLGDVKLIAMLAAWLGLPATLLAFFIGALLGAAVGLVVIAAPAMRDEGEGWATSKLPFGTFLCIGGIVSSLWGEPIIAAYLRAIGISGISLLMW
jgi:leader peptidase (prepilin peptidase)/N-methyltransferase